MRPRKAIDPQTVQSLAEHGASNVAIAHAVGCGEATIRGRFGAEVAKGRARRRLKLRQRQFEAAMDGSVAMLIFLGKVELGQSEAAGARTSDDVDAFTQPATGIVKD